MNGTLAMNSSGRGWCPCSDTARTDTPIRVEENSASQASGHTQAANRRVRLQPRSATPGDQEGRQEAEHIGPQQDGPD